MSTSPSPPSLGGLFLGFLSVGLCGFGGVLPWARRMIVERRRWMTAAEFADLLGLCQFLPGPNIINVSVALGARYHGPVGSVVAFVGLMAAPMAIVLTLATIYDRFAEATVMRNVFIGMTAAASALVLATALKIAAPLKESASGITVAAATVLSLAVFRWPLPLVLAVMAPVSILLAARRAR